MKKIYLAGFDVFAPDARQRGAQMKMLCAGRGCIGLYPLDNEAACAADIFAGNCGLIDQADAVIANLNPFRGQEPDSGTCFEVGYAFAKGKPVFAYDRSSRGDFGLPLNLMLSSAATVVEGGFADALAAYLAAQA